MTRLVFLLTFIVCLQALACNSDPYPTSPMDRLSDSITIQTYKQLKEEFGSLQLAGIGGAADQKIEGFSMSLTHYGVMNKAEVRHLLLRAEEVYLDTINAIDEIRPYLAHSPFSEDGIEIMLVIHTKDGQFLNDPHLSIAYLTNRGITYISTGGARGLETKGEEHESLEEAQQRAQ